MFASKLNKMVVRSLDTMEAYVDYKCDAKGCYRSCKNDCDRGDMGTYSAQYARHAATFNVQ